jgi:PAS domain S-box-containing protein
MMLPQACDTDALRWWTTGQPGAARENAVTDWNLQRHSRLLAESQLRQLAVIEASNDLVATIDCDGFLLSLNDAGHRMLGLAVDADLVGLRLCSCLAPHSAQQLLGIDVAQAIQYQVAHSEVVLRTRQGEEIAASQVLVAHKDPHGNVEFFSVIIRDIRPLQAAEARRRDLLEQLHQTRKMETIGRLASGVAHDFNNIITVIMGYAELGLMNLEPGAQNGEELNIILEASRKASRLTSQLLEFSSKDRIDPQVLDLNEIIGQSEQLVASLMGEDIRMALLRAPDLWPIEIDRSQLEQIILNLAVNARDALSSHGQFTMQTNNCSLDDHEAALLGLASGGDYVAFVVSDTGAGIAAEHLDHIFEPFYTTKTRGKGTGMGLASVYAAVRQNRGGIRVHSTPGEGTSFSIYMPRVRSLAGDDAVYGTAGAQRGQATMLVVDGWRDARGQLDTLAGATPPEACAQQSLPLACKPDAGNGPHGPTGAVAGQQTILVVEDNCELRALMTTVLGARGYRVLEATDGQAALAVFNSSGPIDLVIADVVMPKLDGLELSRRLQALRPRQKILLMSGHSDRIVALREQPVSVNLLSKPFQNQGLVREVRACLDT